MLVTFIDHYRDAFSVEPIWKEWLIASFRYHHYKTLEQFPQRGSVRAKCDVQLSAEMHCVWEDHHRNWFAWQVSKQLK
jgi:hypothetical protein